MFIQTEATPNPATLKFIPGRIVLDGGTMEFASREAAARSPLAEKLFGVPGVTGVFYGSDFVTVTKDDSDWQHLKPAILGAIMEHYMSGAPLLADGSVGSDEVADEADEFFNEDDAETVATIKDLIETRVRPAVANDGGDITFRGFKDGSDWQHLKPAILGAIMEHYMSGAPLLADGSVGSDEAADEDDEFFNEADADTVATIKDLIETRVRPAVASDGGDITFRGFKDGIVYLNMKGSCSGCPSSTATLQHGIQNLLKHFVPDVVEVRPV